MVVFILCKKRLKYTKRGIFIPSKSPPHSSLQGPGRFLFIIIDKICYIVFQQKKREKDLTLKNYRETVSQADDNEVRKIIDLYYEITETHSLESVELFKRIHWFYIRIKHDSQRNICSSEVDWSVIEINKSWIVLRT